MGRLYIVESVSRLRMLAGNENLILGRRSGDEFEAFLSGYSSREEIINDIEEFYQYLDKDVELVKTYYLHHISTLKIHDHN